jgi:hypothetical protein
MHATTSVSSARQSRLAFAATPNRHLMVLERMLLPARHNRLHGHRHLHPRAVAIRPSHPAPPGDHHRPCINGVSVRHAPRLHEDVRIVHLILLLRNLLLRGSLWLWLGHGHWLTTLNGSRRRGVSRGCWGWRGASEMRGERLWRTRRTDIAVGGVGSKMRWCVI